jgi:ABC-type Fe3+ transport system permease subunit
VGKQKKQTKQPSRLIVSAYYYVYMLYTMCTHIESLYKRNGGRTRLKLASASASMSLCLFLMIVFVCSFYYNTSSANDSVMKRGSNVSLTTVRFSCSCSGIVHSLAFSVFVGVLGYVMCLIVVLLSRSVVREHF